MKSLKSRQKKQAKAKAREKNYRKHWNVRKNNWPVPTSYTSEPVLSATRNKSGKWEYKQIGERPVTMYGNKRRLYPGDGVLPKSRKYRESKKALVENKKVTINTLAHTSATIKK